MAASYCGFEIVLERNDWHPRGIQATVSGGSTEFGMAKRITRRLLGVALILTLSALSTHALAHWHAQAADEQHCQICQVGHVATPQAAAPAAIQVPVPVARFVVAEHFVLSLDPVDAPSNPRGPPA